MPLVGICKVLPAVGELCSQACSIWAPRSQTECAVIQKIQPFLSRGHTSSLKTFVPAIIDLATRGIGHNLVLLYTKICVSIKIYDRGREKVMKIEACLRCLGEILVLAW